MAIGLFVKMASDEVAEMIAGAGFDFVVIDTEHGPLSVRDVHGLIGHYLAHGVRPLVRLPDHGYGDGQRYLDAGATGVLVPHVETAGEARSVMQHFLFPPLGSRGMGISSRAGSWGFLPGGADEYVRVGNEDTLRIAMIESPEAIARLDEILAVPGLSAVFVGSGDLALAMGYSVAAPSVTDAIDDVIRRAVEASVAVGAVASHPSEIGRRRQQGCSFVAVGNDAGLFAAAARNLLEACRAGA
jgi:4-hydroxy-2-oxoheptanedioate aldolase